MNDPLLVRELERSRDVTKDARRLADRQRSVARQAHAQRIPFLERHHVKRDAVDLAGAQDRDDVRMLQSRRELDFALEALRIDTSNAVGLQHLDDDAPA